MSKARAPRSRSTTKQKLKSAPNSLYSDALPEAVIGPPQVTRLIREIESLEESIRQLKLVKNAATATDLPHISKLLAVIAESKGLSLKKYADRQVLASFLRELQQSPVVNITFAIQPAENTLRILAHWFRTHGDPYTLLAVDLQPSLLAGCTVRTTNKLFDFSAQHKITKQRSSLVSQVKEAL